MSDKLHTHRSHTCGQLRPEHAGTTVRLGGWVHRVRDFGGIVFIDLRDHYGITQIVVHPSKGFSADVHHWKLESVIGVTGKCILRAADTVNPKITTGEVELDADDIVFHSKVQDLPFSVAAETEMPEHMRLKYRYLDLRTSKMHHNIVVRSKVIASLRRRMTDLGFNEFQTPILTASSPEGARDFLVPSRMHPGQFYALPQAPQQFKQLLMVSGFDRYFQIAPCFRDEDARADRSPGEFYQLDLEMSFATQEDVFNVVENVVGGTFEEFTSWKKPAGQFPHIAYKDALRLFGNDKPDLRNPLRIADVTHAFKGSEFKAFAGVIDKGGVVRALKAPGAASQSRGFHDKMGEFAISLGAKGLGYLVFDTDGIKSPFAKFLTEPILAQIKQATGADTGDVVYFVAEMEKTANDYAGKVRTKLGEELGLINPNDYQFVWIVDFPMYELNDETNAVDFSHNPFSMPQGGLEALNTKDPLTINAYQYDLVCNGIELSSGAIRNHSPEVMYRAFEIAGYSRDTVDTKFAGMINAFKHGAPPHGGIAPGVDRMVMLILGEKNIREIIAFPLNQQAQDLLMNAPSPVSTKQLRELRIKVDLPPGHAK